MAAPRARSLQRAFRDVEFVADRTPTSTDIERCFATLADYRDGGIFVAHYAGRSEWERHPSGDEIVMVVEGATTLVLLLDAEEVRHELGAGELLVVPENTWHRFESPDGVKVMTVTPQPTEHAVDRPER